MSLPASLSSHPNEHSSDSFGEFVAISRAMVAKAERGEWEDVMRMQAERQQRLEAYFAAVVPAELAEQVAAGIREILDLDRRVVALGRQGMDQLSGAMNGLRAGRRAQKAYGDVNP